MTNKVAVLGLGEAGSAIAADLAEASLTVKAWDPKPKVVPPGVDLTASDHAAIAGADLVLSVNLASVAADVARSAVSVLTGSQVFADLNTASPGLKRQIAEILGPSGGLFVDVALLAPVSRRGLRTPALVSSPGPQRFHDLLAPHGMPITILDDQAGSAAARKLVRSIFMKGVAAVVIECLEAAERLDCEAWAREQLLTVIQDEAWIDRFVEGSQTHAARRLHEMTAAAELLAELEVDSFMTEATVQKLVSMSASQPKAEVLTR
jgi:3-hydroxyisobutyrate dehydrogenase-like beta-hydroxyacid dehydrogenase